MFLPSSFKHLPATSDGGEKSTDAFFLQDICDYYLPPMASIAFESISAVTIVVHCIHNEDIVKLLGRPDILRELDESGLTVGACFLLLDLTSLLHWTAQMSAATKYTVDLN